MNRPSIKSNHFFNFDIDNNCSFVYLQLTDISINRASPTYRSTEDVTLDTVGDSISLEYLLALLLFMSLFGMTLIFTQYISGLTYQQCMLPWIQ